MSNPKRLINFSTPYILNGEFFEIISQDGESVTVRCRHCAGRNIYKGSVKSTGNFHMHIKRKHPSLIPKVHESKLNAFINRKSQQKRQSNVNRKLLVKNEKMSGNNEVNFSNEIQRVNLNTRLNPYAEAKFDTIEIKSESQNCDDIVMDLSSETSEHRTDNTESNPPQESQIQLASHHHQSASTRSPSSAQLNCNPVAVAIGTNEIFRALPRIEGVLRNIEREMQLRNQIESNRLFLELAKFKYINPDFAFRF